MSHRRIPFFVAAPITTLDAELGSGELIEIEQRPPEEITHYQGKQIAASGIKVRLTAVTLMIQPCTV